MKFLHILHSEAATGWGGQEIRVFQESQYLADQGHRVSLICRPGSPLEERCRKVNHPRFAVWPVDMPRTASPGALRDIFRLLKTLRPDILHTHSSVDSWLVSFCGRFLGIPIVRTRHVSIPVKNFFPKNWIYSSFPARIITSGEVISNHIAGLNGVDPGAVVSISAGVDLSRFDCKVSGGSLRRELNLEADQPLVGKIGVIRGWKGYDYFIQAVPLVMKAFPDARFVIAGNGPGFDQIARTVRDRGLETVVSLLGHREDVPQIMAALDVLALASLSGEGTPQVIPQAFAMKTPVVATRVGSVPGLLGDGSRGVLVDKGDPESLAKGIAGILRHPDRGRALAEKAFSYCREELTFERMMDLTLAVYYDVLNDNLS